MDGGSVSGNDWTDDRLTRAALGALLKYGAMEVLGLAAKLGPQEAWRLLRGGGQDIESELQPVLPGAREQCPPGTRGPAFAAWAASVIPDEVAQQTDKAGLRFVVPGDGEWPVALGDLARPDIDQLGGVPVGLWVAGPGHLARWCRQAVALVGSRASTRYGEAVAFNLASEMVQGKDAWTVVSGGAYGIDAASHRGALALDGRTVGLFANGLDLYYPPGNAGLIQMIKASGLIVSELPPGSNPTKHGFLARNRLIAALSSGSVVVEAAARSGARNTASWAAGTGRVVMAVPGPVTSAMSVTTHRLIRDGQATLVSSADDIRALLAPFGQSPELPTNGPPRWQDELSGDQAVVREALPGRGGLTISEVALASGVTVPRCIDALRKLAELGVAAVNEQGRWRACRPVNSE